MSTATPNEASEKPEVFGEKGDFWGRYDMLADAKDRVMLQGLGENLDVLLIFAGLFSAVNTAFIVLTLASLSAPASYQTNALLILVVMHADNNTLTPSDLSPSFTPSTAAIRQNCTFFASLCSSILAAAGAVLAKQWLQSYARTGQTGTRQKQAMLRTAKWIGAETWGLRVVVEALPTLLLISLALFFAALCDLLWSASRPVAFVVIGFTAVGAMSYGLKVIAAALDTFCPYQTAVSTTMREVTVGLKKLMQASSSRTNTVSEALADFAPFLWIKQGYLRGLAGLTLGYSNMARLMWKGTEETSATWEVIIDEGTADARDEILSAQAVLWMLENSTEQADVLACADNISTLSRLHSAQLIGRSPSFPILVKHFEAALNVALKKGSQGSDVTAALALGKAIAHAVIADPMHCSELVVPVLTELQIHQLEAREAAGDLWLLCTVFGHLKSKVFGYSPSRLMFATAKALPPAQQFIFLATLSILKLSPFGGCFGLIDFRNSPSDALLSFLYMEITDIATGAQRPMDQRVEEVWKARSGYVDQFC